MKELLDQLYSCKAKMLEFCDPIATQAEVAVPIVTSYLVLPRKRA